MELDSLQLGRRIIETVGWGNVLVLGADDVQAQKYAVAFREAGLDTLAIGIGALASTSSRCADPLFAADVFTETGHLFDIVACVDALDTIPVATLDAVLSRIIGVARRHVFIWVGRRRGCGGVPQGSALDDRAFWEKKLIAGGLRKHPRYYFAIDYESLEVESGALQIVMEKPSHELLTMYPLSALAEERDLHMDMSREQGRRSDGHMIRYYKAAAFVREGDRVLDAACGLGYGSHILAANSLASRITGIDGSEYAIRYARMAFAAGGVPEFHVGYLPQALEVFPDASFDFIVSFETLEHLEDPESFLQECHRILSPGGRLMTCVPNDWTEADGRDPNPFHFHVYEWDKFHAQIGRLFLLEKSFAQTASRKKVDGRWKTSERQWYELSPAESSAHHSEWCVSLSMKAPELGTGIAIERSIAPYVLSDSPPPYLDFSRQYENPWLVRGMISMGLRMSDVDLLTQMASSVESSSSKSDGDAAASVLAYAWLSQRGDRAPPTKILGMLDRRLDRLGTAAHSPIKVRWTVSLLYVAAQIRLAAGDRAIGMGLLNDCLAQPYLEYSVLLGVKVASAALQLGIMYAGDGNIEQARDAWRRGLAVGQAATALNWEQEFGKIEQLPDFVLRELTTLFDLVTQCATALGTVRVLPARPYAVERVAINKSAQVGNLLDASLRLSSSIGILKAELADANSRLEDANSRLEDANSRLEDANSRLEDANSNVARLRLKAQQQSDSLLEFRSVMGESAKEILRAKLNQYL